MSASFFFYDLETSGINPRDSRIMQFAGIRTDSDFNVIGDPVDILIKLSPDILPEPDAIMLTGITPQQVMTDGMSEAEFLKYFYDEIVTPDTVFLGYNSVRFDDEFMRFLHYRNFYDAYEWQWKNNCSRWDLLDVVRMTRALRPDGIIWPTTPEGKPTNRLELMTKMNNLDHYKAHDALSDVHATIAVAKLIKDKQPKLFDHLFEIRKKDKVRPIVDSGNPFMYTSSHFPSSYLHTTAAVLIAKNERQDAAIVYDLRADPTPFLTMDTKQLLERWRYNSDPKAERLPVKTLKYNRCPAIAPGVVQDAASLERLELSLETITKHLTILKAHQQVFADKLMAAAAELDATQDNDERKIPADVVHVDARLYDGFYDDHDKYLLPRLRQAPPAEVGDFIRELHDDRLKQLIPLYKARNYPSSLTSEERAVFEDYCAKKLLSGGKQSRMNRYFKRLSELAATSSLDKNQQYLLEELQLYGESIVPVDVTE